MRNYLRARRQYWANSPHKGSIVVGSAVLSILVVVLDSIRALKTSGDERCWAVIPIVVIVVVWLRYGYDKATMT